MLGTPLTPVYAILDTDLAHAAGHDPDALLDAWLDAGVRLIQLRGKTMASGDLLPMAERMARRAASAGATFIVNDRADLARLSGAAGVHVGQDDLQPDDARAVVGRARIVGVSTHNLDQARRALETTADYVAIGPVFATASKQNPDPVVGLSGVGQVAELARRTARPVVAIGGITLESAPAALAAGADSVALISALLAGDPGARAREFIAALSSSPHARPSS
jgi:thiamine-phosphate pyrophosphorylase